MQTGGGGGGCRRQQGGAGREGRGRCARKAVGLKAMVVGFEDRTDASINANSRPAVGIWRVTHHVGGGHFGPGEEN